MRCKIQVKKQLLPTIIKVQCGCNTFEMLFAPKFGFRHLFYSGEHIFTIKTNRQRVPDYRYAFRDVMHSEETGKQLLKVVNKATAH